MDRKKPMLARVLSHEEDGSVRTVTMRVDEFNSLPFLHGRRPLGYDHRRRMKQLWEPVGRFTPYKSQSAWVDAMETEGNPDRQIEIYEDIARAMERFKADHPDADHGAKRVAVMALVMVTCHIIDIPSQLKGVTDADVAYLKGLLGGKRLEEMTVDELSGAASGQGLPAEMIASMVEHAVPIRKLMDDPHGLAEAYAEAFKGADVLYGLNTANGGLKVIHGKAALDALANSEEDGEIGYFVVAYDHRTDELEKLCVCSQVHRGGHDVE